MHLKKLAGAGLALLGLSGLCGAAQDFRIEPGWSHVEFSISNFGFHTVLGRFKTFVGTITYDEADVTRSIVSVTLLTTDIDTNNKKRDAHLRKKEFFETDHYPQITFLSQSIAKQGAGYLMKGLLTIKGRTQPVELPFRFTSDRSADGRPALHAEASTTINRHDFGIDYGSNFSVGKEVKITIQILALP